MEVRGRDSGVKISSCTTSWGSKSWGLGSGKTEYAVHVDPCRVSAGLGVYRGSYSYNTFGL